MRVLHFTDAPRMGGAERVLLDVAAACVAAGHDTHVLTPQQWLADLAGATGAHAGVVADERFRDAESPWRRRKLVLGQARTLFAALRRIKPDVLHIHNGGYPGSDLCRVLPVLARAARIPRTVMTVHAMPRDRAEAPPGQGPIDRAVWASTHTVIGATRIVGDVLEAERGLPRGHFVRVPYGVADPGGEEGAATFRAGFPEPVVVGMVSATSDEQKGHAVLIEAISRTAGVRGVLIGSPPPPGAGSHDRATVAGRVDDLGAAYHGLDALVVPSVRDESLPLVILEAMACATPVIASRLSGIPEAVRHGETGWLFAPGDVDALAAALADPAPWVEWGRAGRAVYEREYTVDAMTSATLDTYIA